jgi:hypothetical protein
MQGTTFLATVGADCEVAAARRLVIICDEIFATWCTTQPPRC